MQTLLLQPEHVLKLEITLAAACGLILNHVLSKVEDVTATVTVLTLTIAAGMFPLKPHCSVVSNSTRNDTSTVAVILIFKLLVTSEDSLINPL